MNSSKVRGIVTGLVIAVLSIALTACSGGGGSNKLDGVYHAASGGPITITIKGGKAVVQIAGESQTLDYKVEGNKLTILNPQEGDVEFTINDDGTLTGQLGLMTKTP